MKRKREAKWERIRREWQETKEEIDVILYLLDNMKSEVITQTLTGKDVSSYGHSG